jgi:hypothetical protein
MDNFAPNQLDIETFSGPRPASIDSRLSQPGLIPSGQVYGQICPGSPRTFRPISLSSLIIYIANLV